MTNMLRDKETDEKICLFDLDGTLADYSGELAKQMNEIRHPSEPEFTRNSFGGGQYPDFVERRRTMITRQESFWENLDILDDGKEIYTIALAMGFSPHILTQGPSKKSEAWIGKHKWCMKNFPDVDLTITRNKGLFYGRVLVDDWPEYVKAWLKHRPRGLAVVPARSWNREMEGKDRVVRVDIFNPEQKKMLEDALLQAFKRET